MSRLSDGLERSSGNIRDGLAAIDPLALSNLFDSYKEVRDLLEVARGEAGPEDPAEQFRKAVVLMLTAMQATPPPNGVEYRVVCMELAKGYTAYYRLWLSNDRDDEGPDEGDDDLIAGGRLTLYADVSASRISRIDEECWLHIDASAGGPPNGDALANSLVLVFNNSGGQWALVGHRTIRKNPGVAEGVKPLRGSEWRLKPSPVRVFADEGP